MSWSSRIGQWGGRFSPFGRSHSSGAPQVNDSDFSYITSEDLKRSQDEQSAARETGPPRDTDVLVLKSKRISYPVHFPAYSIDKGELLIREVREQAAKKTNSDPKRIKLLYKGKILKDDGRSCRAEGLREGSEIMCTIADSIETADSEDSDDDGVSLDGGVAEGDAPKRKRNRNKNKKRRNKKASGTSTPSDNLPQPSSDASGPSAQRPAVPVTAMGKLDALNDKLQGIIPQCEQFLSNPPVEPAKKSFEHKKLAETILAQVLLKLDGVETEGDPEARARRKELVKEAQRVLNSLDDAVKV